ncbi:hypothetical protein KGV31_004065 [Vibrio parahaemolyticus]|nr:hypothetical protein [Vibrio parahaemolyticus]EGQ8464372.1 hypothetical protein [Vibrio parahaemolyticus]EGQ9405959.1 hypothetical protein [Vibrio parahaemolyticus]EGR0297570.1 hypothetical protein [Vibrio parahaemolyticus]EHM6955212.1 hypothetical protein [Vibrio parahaemolyticus]
MVKLTNEEAVARLKAVHGDRYDYSLVNWLGHKKKITLICKKHGEFEQAGYRALSGSVGCLECLGRKSVTGDRVVDAIDRLFGGQYEFSGFRMVSEGRSRRKHAVLICPQHGEFTIRPNHLFNGVGCAKCGDDRAAELRSASLSEFVEKSRIVHGDRFDYSKSVYERAIKKVVITCPEHGDFEQTPNDHLNGYGCPFCGGRLPIGKREFIERARSVFGDMYDYSMVEYENQLKPVLIGCKNHGCFWKQPKYHLAGSGCPACSVSGGELIIMRHLDLIGVDYLYEHSPEGLVNPDTGRKLRFDFYLPDHLVAIEFDGAHHFHENHFSDDDDLWAIRHRDAIKDAWCVSNGVSMVRIPYWEKSRIKNILDEKIKAP